MLHRVLCEHLATFLARAEEGAGAGLPRFVRRELRRYVDCGILAFGFARVHCSMCGEDELVAASVQGRVALGAKSGARVQRLGRQREVEFEGPLFRPGELCCDIEQFSLHAKVRIEAQDREGLEGLCRYVARPPIKVERLSLAPDGRVIYGLRRSTC